MKFALATGLLSGSLPVVSASAADTTVQAAQNFLLRNTNGAIQGSTLQSIQDCDPTSKDPDVGVLSCGEGRFCMPKEDTLFGGICESTENLLKLAAKFRKRGALKNPRKGVRKPFVGAVECDPTADVGILSCESDETCMPSTFSSKGGLCTSSTEGRRLQFEDLTQPLGICDNTSTYYLAYNCDCRGLDNVTGNGVVTCKGYQNYCLGTVYTTGLYATCTDICVSSTFAYTYVNKTTPFYNFCIESFSPLNQSMCLNQSLAQGTCSIEFNGNQCSSCAVVTVFDNYTAIQFDCANVGAPGVPPTTSYYFADLLPLVQETCLAQERSATDSCDICNGPLVNPDAVATVMDFSFSCYEFSTLLNSSTCEMAALELAETCCNASGTDTDEGSPEPDDNATDAPGSGGGNMPSAGRSTTFLAKSTWLATLGLAVAWAFGHAH